MRFDDILKEIGGFGLYQKIVFFLTCPPNLLAGLLMLNPVFLLGTPLHRCSIPGYENDTYHVEPGDTVHACLVNLTIATSSNKNDPCHLYRLSDVVDTALIVSQIVQNGSCEDQQGTNITEPCSSWVYDRTVFTSTFVSEMNLVCDKKMLVADAEMIFYFGMLIGSVVSGILSDVYGRKPVMYTNILLLVSSSVGLCFVTSYVVFVIVQFLVGASLVATLMTVYLISLEMTSSENHVWPGVIARFPHVAGLVILAAVAYGLRDWFWIQLYTAVPGVVLLSYWWLMPESPRWLLTKGRVQEARTIIRAAIRWNKVTVSEALFHAPWAEEDEASANCLQLLRSKTLGFRTLVIFFNWTVVSLVYFGITLNTEMFSEDLYLNFGLLGLVEVPAYLIAIVLLDRMGRLKLYCLSMLIGGVACASTALVAEFASEDLDHLILALALLGKLCITTGFCVTYVHSAELFPTIVRNSGLGGAFLFGRLGTMVAPFIVTWGKDMDGFLGRTFSLIVFGSLSFTSGILSSLILPETLNRHLPDTIADGERFGRSGAYHIARSIRRHTSQYTEVKGDDVSGGLSGVSGEIDTSITDVTLVGAIRDARNTRAATASSIGIDSTL